MAQWGLEDKEADAPKYTTNAVTGESGIEEFGTKVFGVDTTEAELVNGPASPGWVRVTEGTGGRAGRRTYETLVAMKSITGDDDDDDEFPDTPVEGPENTVLPVISGTSEVNETLTVTPGSWTGNPTPTLTYQWFADDVAITGETETTLELTEDMEDALITVSETGTNLGGSITVVSLPTTPIAGA